MSSNCKIPRILLLLFIESCNVRTTYGECCIFPFTYKGIKYYHCITVGNENTPWCYYKSRWGTKWGNCKEGKISRVRLVFTALKLRGEIFGVYKTLIMGHANSFRLIMFFVNPLMSVITIFSLEGKFRLYSKS